MKFLKDKTTSTLRGGDCGSFKVVPHTQGNLKSDIQDILRNNDSHSMAYFLRGKHLQTQQECLKGYEIVHLNCRGNQKIIEKLFDLHQNRLTTTCLSKVIFSFHIMNGERFMKCDLQKEFLDISDELKQQMEIEKNDLIQMQMELYLFLTKTSFQIAPNNSNEREDILKGCLSGIISSMIQMKPSAELLESLFKGAYFTKCMQCRKIENNMKCIFKLILCNGKQQQQHLEEIILQTQSIHGNLVQNSNNWKNHQLWIYMIGKIQIYNPLLTKQKFYQLTSSFDFGAQSTQIWKEYLNKGLLIQMNHSKDQAIILLNQLQNKELPQQDRLILEDCFKEWENFILLKDFLLYEQNQNLHFTFGSYLKCKLQVGYKQENILGVDQIQKFLDFIISNKLFALIQENYEKLGEVVKIYRNLKKNNTQFNQRILQSTYNSYIKKIYLNFKEYFKNTLNIIKILRLNSRQKNFQIEQLQKKIIEYNNLQQLRYLMMVLEQIVQSLIQELKEKMSKQKNQSQNQSDKTDEMEILYEQKEFIYMELKKLKQKDPQNSLLDNLLLRISSLSVAFLNQQNFLEVAQSLNQFITNSWKQLEKLEISLSLNNNHLISLFENQLNNLYLYYEDKSQEFKNDSDESNQFLKQFIQIKYEVEVLLHTENFKEITLLFCDMQQIKCIQNLRFKYLKLQQKLLTIKKSFQNILLQTNPQELKDLQKIINLDQFLISVLQKYAFQNFRKGCFRVNYLFVLPLLKLEAKFQIEHRIKQFLHLNQIIFYNKKKFL